MCKNSYKFTIDTDFQAKNLILENVRSFRVFVNDEETKIDENFKVKENDIIHIKGLIRNNSFQSSLIKIEGYKYTEIYDVNEDVEIKDIILN